MYHRFRSITKGSIVTGTFKTHTLVTPPKEGSNQMYLLIRYPGGIIVEAVVLAKGSNRLRVAVAGFPETIELRRADALWSTESGEPVEFDFLMSDRFQAKRPASSIACAAMVV